MRAAVALALLLSGCPRPVPDHLRLDTQTTSEPAVEVVDLETAVAALIGRDPLARSLRDPDPMQMATVPGGQQLLDFSEQMKSLREAGDAPRTLYELEIANPGSAVVPLARGERLARTDGLLAQLEGRDEAIERQVMLLLTDLRAVSGQEGLTRPPLEFVGSAATPDGVRRWADRYALSGWLQAPGIPVSAAANALRAAPYDDLRSSPIGALLMARSQQAASPDLSLDELTLATELALLEAAADRDSEQRAFSQRRDAAGTELSSDRPIKTLLDNAVAQHTANAGSERSTGAVMLAMAALRWRNDCAWQPCGGLDRTTAMVAAGNWDSEIADLAALWQVIALKHAVDSLEVAREKPSLSPVLLSVVDALSGTGAGPFDEGVIRRRTASVTLWHSLGLALGQDAATTWDDVHPLLLAHLAKTSQAALERNSGSRWQEPLERITARAALP